MPQNPADLHRRELLRCGTLGLMGLLASPGVRASVPAAAGGPPSAGSLPGFGRARRCLLL